MLFLSLFIELPLVPIISTWLREPFSPSQQRRHKFLSFLFFSFLVILLRGALCGESHSKVADLLCLYSPSSSRESWYKVLHVFALLGRVNLVFHADESQREQQCWLYLVCLFFKNKTTRTKISYNIQHVYRAESRLAAPICISQPSCCRNGGIVQPKEIYSLPPSYESSQWSYSCCCC